MKVAIFDVEGDDCTFEMYAREFDYVVKKGIAAEEAVKLASGFVKGQGNRMKKIMDTDGRIIGYELRPLFDTLRYGSPDIMDVKYKMTDKNSSCHGRD